MATREIQEGRVRHLSGEAVRDSDYVLYWMQQAQRAEHNHALEYAAQKANELGQPLLVAFGLTDDYPSANARHYAFMLEGLKDTQESLARRGINFVVHKGAPDEVALRLGENASMIVLDGAYLRPERSWRRRVAEEAGRRVVRVESNVVVPVELASDRRETAAQTLRPKIRRHLDEHLVELLPTKIEKDSLDLGVGDGIDLSDIEAVLDGMHIDKSVEPLRHLYTGGFMAAKERLDELVEEVTAYRGCGKKRIGPCDEGLMQAHSHGRVSRTFRSVGAVRCTPLGDRLRLVLCGPEPGQSVLFQALHDAVKPGQLLLIETFAQYLAEFAQRDSFPGASRSTASTRPR